MSKGRIILADDHELFRRGMRQLLETEDYEVVAEAGNGPDALARAADTKADIILLDIGMPGEVDGLEAARRPADAGGSGRPTGAARTPEGRRSSRG